MIGILGGTFDPIHYGHLRPADEVRVELALDEMRVIPSARPPHREPPIATASQRLRMTELAVQEFTGFRVDDREFQRKGPSYTVPTLESLRVEIGARPLCLLLGADTFNHLETWYQWPRLLELAHLVIMRRPGWLIPNEDELPMWARSRIRNDKNELTRVPAGWIAWVQVKPYDISATRIRALLAQGEPLPIEWLPLAVQKYIHDQGLYQGNA